MLSNQYGFGGSVQTSPGQSVLAATVPAAPGNVGCTSGQNDNLTVTWTAPADNGGSDTTDYQLRYSVDQNSWTTIDTTSTNLAAALSSLTDGASYVAEVQAINVDGASSWSAAGGPCLAFTAPAPPSNVDLSDVTSNGATLNWTPPCEQRLDYRLSN